MRVAGIMSGTSLDGIDMAVVDIARSGKLSKVVTHSTSPYPAAVREALMAVSNKDCHTRDISRLNFLLPELYAKALRDLCVRESMPLDSIGLIGCHGQTIFHEDVPAAVGGKYKVASTLQIGDGCVLAERTGIPVVSNFRTRDMAAGGRGAPMVPYADLMLFGHPKRGRVSLNLGGIGNITSLPPGAKAGDVIAFDTGPANMVMDLLMEHHTGGRLTYDKGGRYSAEGRVDQELLERLLADPYYRRKPPKTTGREQYGREFIQAFLDRGLSPQDSVATACRLTACTVALAIGRFVRPRHVVDDLIVGGGGVRNPELMSHLRELLQGVQVLTTNDFGIDSDAKEAIAFALMAHATWCKRPGNIATATGAKRAVVLGTVTFA
ncbi:MAG: anhydro-N-acetylmuramic acid kinase [Acidobacteria bacterium]|nr:anhydro-N-acetylmuramic acid kinase [Acidobacteriota bacterium]